MMTSYFGAEQAATNRAATIVMRMLLSGWRVGQSTTKGTKDTKAPRRQGPSRTPSCSLCPSWWNQLLRREGAIVPHPRQRGHQRLAVRHVAEDEPFCRPHVPHPEFPVADRGEGFLPSLRPDQVQPAPAEDHPEIGLPRLHDPVVAHIAVPRRRYGEPERPAVALPHVPVAAVGHADHPPGIPRESEREACEAWRRPEEAVVPAGLEGGAAVRLH